MRTRNSTLMDVAPVTLLCLSVCIAYHIYLLFVTQRYVQEGLASGGGMMGIPYQVLDDYGGCTREGLWNGGWHRLVLPMFMHAGFLHILFNMMWLYRLGPALEVHFGSSNFGTIYFLSGLGCIAMSMIFGGNLSVGASGCVFGMLGASLAIKVAACYDFRRALKNTEVKHTALYIGALFLICFLIPNVDHWGHLGGLLIGYFYGWLFEAWRNKQRLGTPLLAVSLGVIILMVVACRWMVFNPHYHVHQGVVAESKERVEEADLHFEEARAWAKHGRSYWAGDEIRKVFRNEYFVLKESRIPVYEALLFDVASNRFLSDYGLKPVAIRLKQQPTK